MMKLIYAVLLIVVCHAGVEGQGGCFMRKLTGCSQQLSGKVSSRIPDLMLCKYREQIFACIRESAEECSKGHAYNFDPYENMYNNLCTPGTPLNLKFEKHRGCFFDTMAKSTICVQDIIDLVSHKKVTPEVMVQIGKLSCERRTSINNCYAGSIEKECGKEARDVLQAINEPSEKVNELICHDLLNE